MSQPIRCPHCGNVVAIQREGGSWEIRKGKRVAIIRPGGVDSMQCEDCGHGWSIEAEGDYEGRLALPTLRRVLS